MEPLKKVVCINGDWIDANWFDRLKERLFGRTKADPKEGEIYTVVSENEAYYTLDELDHNEAWDKSGFVPVRDNFIAISFEKVIEVELIGGN